jgi:NitT/TauT family transport system ATP-binding protein
MGLWSFRDAFPAQLSLGMARRVAIARAFAICPDVVLLDEPFVSLDRAMAERSRNVLLTAWNRSPIAAILVTHDLREAAALADRILMLSQSPAHIIADIQVPENVCRIGGEAALHYAGELQNIATDLAH